MPRFYKPLIAGLGACLSLPLSAEIIISEYSEGKSYNKAIELYNPTSQPINLTNYQLTKYTNGDLNKTATLSLNGTLAPKATFVISHVKADSAIKNKAQLVTSNSVINYNGDDPIALFYNQQLLDIIGTPGKRNNFGKDQTIQRTIGQASQQYQPAQWQFASANNAEVMAKTLGNVAFGTPSQNTISCKTGDVSLISQLQGPGERSPLIPTDKWQSDNHVLVEGIVTQLTPNRYQGFFIQEEVQDEDADPNTSEGIFVFGTPTIAVNIGDKVRVQGLVKEHYNETQLVLKQAQVCSKASQHQDSTRIVELTAETSLQALEPYEGMQVRWHGDAALTVTKNYGFNFKSRRNDMVLTQGAPLYKPTQLFPALSEEAKQLTKANQQNQITIETDHKQQNGVISFYPPFEPNQFYIRIGDTIDQLTGVIKYAYGQYSVIPTQLIADNAFDHSHYPRQVTPPIKQHGNLRIASFNVLNYFNRVEPGATPNPANNQNRGATNLADFTLQQTKIVSALVAMDAGIIGLMEIENNGFTENSAIHSLVTALNQAISNPDDHYQFVKPKSSTYIGNDAITVGILYRPAQVAIVGNPHIVTMPHQQFTVTSAEDKQRDFDKGQRDSLIQTFKTQSGETLSVVVNHFKSKGSMCLEDYLEYALDGKISLDSRGRVTGKPTAPNYLDDLQGSCNELRVSAAYRLGEYLKQHKKSLGDNILVLGDLNAYGQEDPLLTLTDFQANQESRPINTAVQTVLAGKPWQAPQTITTGYGLINLNTKLHGNKTFSYSYEGELGNLDHALASPTLANKVVDIIDWHINSVENSLFEYSRKYSGQLPKSDNLFSASDHDPIIIELQLTPKKSAKTELNQLIEHAWTVYQRVVINDVWHFYPHSLKWSLTKSLLQAMEVQTDDKATQQQVDKVTSDLQQVLDKASTFHPVVYKSGLAAAIEIAGHRLYLANQTQVLWYFPVNAQQKLANHISQAKAIYQNNNSSQQQVNHAAYKLTQALFWFEQQRQLRWRQPWSLTITSNSNWFIFH
ncbi:ExeM/NucH family extracellular endonuclease [Endozoicomonas sp. SM1973]|uniref:ExeM/NucH family extracellular endonuclease n=1 Tax=Spartinivicinus marinus TaxID=2994442 RepID=A0A853I824_9GAMM|nr:ExeM/NucH family extracellular endonuclease [Spartinivicinus marinus]MCX4029031.1 ExeM/NucH family extracellular endonuclease [Spartinivicinus marinus]NYZ65385.1 ExeM/NucH family extracellular endonuclease [Spartinivicinus marinus]